MRKAEQFIDAAYQVRERVGRPRHSSRRPAVSPLVNSVTEDTTSDMAEQSRADLADE
jgi:hypothetical protein